MCILNQYCILKPAKYEFLKSQEAKQNYLTAEKEKEYPHDNNPHAYIDDGKLVCGYFGLPKFGDNNFWIHDDYPNNNVKKIIDWYSNESFIKVNKVLTFNELQTDASKCTNSEVINAMNHILSQLSFGDAIVFVRT